MSRSRESQGVNLRKWLYFTLVRMRGQRLGSYYRQMVKAEREGIPPDTTKRLLVELLEHCKQCVPYYSKLIRELGDGFRDDPEAYLRDFPILTKDIIRSHFDELKSRDLDRRRWFYNTSGGSTGEPVRLIQDRDYAARSGAVKLLYSKLVGGEIGKGEVRLWGSETDIHGSTRNWRARLVNSVTNTTILNAFRMTADDMRCYIAHLNKHKSSLIVAYADSLYELARFAEEQGLQVQPQTAVITSAATLFPFMREVIERVFQCRVYNRYGSREVGDVACERPGCRGLWVAPWGNYVEIVDHDGRRVPAGTEGEILVTSLTNYAMPLVRYRIGDYGMLAPRWSSSQGVYGQRLEHVLGRVSDTFLTPDGTLVHSGYFELLLYFKDWIKRFQVIQKDYSTIVFRIIKSDCDHELAELDEIVTQTKLIMGEHCEVHFEFVDEIEVSPSGKRRYTICEISS